MPQTVHKYRYIYSLDVCDTDHLDIHYTPFYLTPWRVIRNFPFFPNLKADLQKLTNKYPRYTLLNLPSLNQQVTKDKCIEGIWHKFFPCTRPCALFPVFGGLDQYLLAYHCWEFRISCISTAWTKTTLSVSLWMFVLYPVDSTLHIYCIM